MKAILKSIAFAFALLWLLALNVTATNQVYFVFSDFGGGVSYFSQTNVVLTVKPLSFPGVVGSATVLKDWMRFTNTASGTTTGSFHAGVYQCEITAKNTESKFQITVTNSATALNAASLISVPTNVVSGASMGYSIAAANNRFIEDPLTQTNGQFLTWNGSAWVPTNGVAGSGSGDVTTSQLNLAVGNLGTNSTNFARSIGLALTNYVNDLGTQTSTDLADLQDSINTQILGTNAALLLRIGTLGTNATNYARSVGAAATNLVETLFNAGRTNTLTVYSNIDLTLAGNPPWLRWYWSSTNEYTLGDVINDSVVLNYIRNQQLLQSARLQVLGGLTANNITNTGTFYGNGAGLTNLPGVGTSGQYVSNYNGTVSNSFRIVSSDGNGFVNALYQNGNTLQITNGTQGVVGSYNEDTDVWDFNGIAPLASLTAQGTAFLSVSNAHRSLSNFVNSSTVAISNQITLPIDFGSNLTALTNAGRVSVSGSAGGGSSGLTTNAPPYTLSYSGTNLVVDFLALGATNDVKATLTQNSGLVLTNIVAGKSITLALAQDSTGNRLIVSNSVNLRFGVDITGIGLSTNANAVDLVRIYGYGTNGLVVGNVRGYAP